MDWLGLELEASCGKAAGYGGLWICSPSDTLEFGTFFPGKTWPRVAGNVGKVYDSNPRTQQNDIAKHPMWNDSAAGMMH